MKPILIAFASIALAQAAEVTYRYSGTTNSTMSVNNGTNTGTLPAGSAYTGTVVYDDAQPVTPTPFYGGTRVTYAFTRMTFSTSASTVTFGPGVMNVYDNVNPPNGIPVGDSLYINLTGSVAPGGLVNGAAFNFIFLGFYDATATAFSGGVLPPSINLATLAEHFIEFNYGTQGVPYGAGNTSVIQPLATFVKGSATPTPPPSISTTSLPGGTVGSLYAVSVVASAPNNDPLALSVSGLPSGLSFSGSTISGTPLAVGNSNVSITATDTVTSLSTTVTLPLTINAAPIGFAPTLADGIVNSPYSSTFAPATGGTGIFTYSVTGLPPGLSLNGTTISGTTALAAVSPIFLTATDSAGASVQALVNLRFNFPAGMPCSGSSGVITAYAARTPGFIVINGGVNLMDHLWTTLLNPTNTTFQGGLINWFQTGLIVDWVGTADGSGCILSRLTVKPKVTIDTTFLPNATAGQPYLGAVNVSWGVGPYALTVSGLPAGLGFNGRDITGTPAAIGAFSVTILAVDTLGVSASKVLSLTVVDPPIAFTPSLASGTVGTAYTATLIATGFGPFTFTATGLPPGLTLNGSVIAGTPSAAGTFTVTLTAKDAAMVIASISIPLTIRSVATGNYTVPDESKGLITGIGPDFLMVGAKKLIWNTATKITVNTPQGERRVIDGWVKMGMKVQWKGLRDSATNTTLALKLEVN